jgi:O-antigen/teichoic acid export membrane protein
MKADTFLRHAAVYGLGTLLVQAGSFVLIPIYTRYLGPADYGVMEVLSRTAEVLYICVLVNGLRQATLAFYNQGTDAAHRRCVAGTSVVLAAFSGVLGAALLVGGSRLLLAGQGGYDRTLVALAAAGLLGDALFNIPLALVQARVESGTYFLATLSHFAVRIALALLLVVGWGLKVEGALAAGAIASGLHGLFFAGRELARARGAFDGATFRQMVTFSAPFLPTGVGMFVLNSGDRFFLLHYGGSEAVGVYALGYKLAWAVDLFTRLPLCMVWSAQMYHVARRPDAARVFGDVFTWVVAAHIAGGLGLCLFQDEVIAVAAGPRYAAAAAVLPVVVAAGVCATAAMLLDAGFYVRRRTALKVPVTLGAVAVTLAAYALLIPPWGAMGAAVATVVGFASLAALTYRAAQKVFPVPYDLRRVAFMALLAAGLWLASRALPATAWVVPVKLGLWLAFPCVLWAGGAVTASEKEWVRAALRRLRGPEVSSEAAPRVLEEVS